ncbi:ABC-type dipeptide/oligopeptide/nickel transport system permease subunit [Kibdelosporangium banguiense]|uniref:ABC-type dipeptide/oligopeptide/nickel transport system permease subunit n=1 Tax=Kibdelosporangium banguiense TaxID=1365924 RepID=A0ABS4U2W2_9PSEU|nr:ABC transporter permease [Kibdelosporangium banguiense]MBP2331007.1 ABC-type dipeptide/oligopeptide/nickel transport system permease subunit [Kibdelosporangium banguiense]
MRRFGLTGVVGAVLVLVVLTVALAGPMLAPHGATDRVGRAFASPGAQAWLGTDHLGRDVLSRVLHGGISILLLSVIALGLAYLVGGAIGLAAAVSRGVLDAVLMRPLDLLLALPAFLVLAVLATGSGRGAVVVVAAVALGNVPGIARVVRAAGREVAVRGWVEMAHARGERRVAIARREVLPNIVPALLADAGVRATAVIGLVGTANFLGLGLQPPLADWALMVAENRSGMTLQPWAVLAPAGCIALLAIGINLIADALARPRTQS